MAEITIYERAFSLLVEDSLRFLFLSEEAMATGNYDNMQLFSRSSAIFSMLILESAANCLIDTLELEKSVFKDIDRMTILAKYDFFLRVKGYQNGLKRGCKLVQDIQELKSLRDGIVHPKKSKLVLQVIDEEKGQMEGEYQKTNQLKISDAYQAWNTNDAVMIARAVHGFLQDYFFTLCNMTSDQSCAILYSEKEVPFDNDEDIGIPYFLIHNKSKLDSLGIKTDYINSKDE